MRLKALAEIYTMHPFAQLYNLNFLSNFAKNSATWDNLDLLLNPDTDSEGGLPSATWGREAP